MPLYKQYYLNWKYFYQVYHKKLENLTSDWFRLQNDQGSQPSLQRQSSRVSFISLIIIHVQIQHTIRMIKVITLN